MVQRHKYLLLIALSNWPAVELISRLGLIQPLYLTLAGRVQNVVYPNKTSVTSVGGSKTSVYLKSTGCHSFPLQIIEGGGRGCSWGRYADGAGLLEMTELGWTKSMDELREALKIILAGP